MSHTATERALQGVERLRTVADSEIVLIPGNPGDTYTRGDMVAMDYATAGKSGTCITCADSAAEAIGRVTKTIVCAGATQAFPIPGPGGGISDLDGDAAKTLIPVEVDLPAGTKVFAATIANHTDETVVSYTASTRAVALTTGLSADNYGNGAYVYVYEGAGKGELNVIEDYDHTGGAAELLVIFHRPFNATLDTTSKLVILSSGAAADDGRGFFGRMDLDDKDAVDLSDGYDDGNWLLYCDFLKLAQYIENNLAVPVIRAVHQHTSPNA